ncbi:MAG: winged helix-turn-helix transcriptional regulator [Acidimicrobiaceae bacterium]|nr:winged helix-turn-helix transcriptional regulator [Acidimicrobiaceae bacterium]
MEDQKWLSKEESELWIHFLAVSQLVDRLVDQHLRKEFDLSHSDYEILARLSEAPDRILRMGELANTIFAPKSRLSHQIDRLALLGWVSRKGCPSDGRGVMAQLTDRGYELLKAIAPSHVASVRSYFVDLIPKEQMECFTATLATVLKAIPGGCAVLPPQFAEAEGGGCAVL